MENKPALTSEQRLAYIGDMADIETREFTMRKAIDNLTKNNESFQSDLNHLANRCHTFEQQREQAQQNLQKTPVPKELPIKPEMPQGYEEFQKKKTINGKPENTIFYSVCSFLFHYFFCCALTIIAIVGIIYFLILKREPLKEDIWFLCLSAIGPILLFSVLYVSNIKWHLQYKKDYYRSLSYDESCTQYKEKYERYEKQLNLYQSYLKKYEQAELEFVEAKETYEKKHKEYRTLIDINNLQIALLQESIQSLHSQKEDLYSIGIIPPDYRQMDCVIMLHQIFRNGLKDNMADAILLYEERVFRQEVIRGIDKIYNMLGHLNDSMRAIESRLMEVKQELQMIGSDMSTQLAAIADNQSRLLSEMEDSNEAQAAYAAAQEQWQREQLAETRASRYAAEAVQRSNEKYEWYMDQHRRGFM